MLDDLSINKLALNSETQGGARYYYLESTIDRAEIPYVSEDYVLRMAIATQLDISAAIIDLGELFQRPDAGLLYQIWPENYFFKCEFHIILTRRNLGSGDRSIFCNY